MVEELRSIRSAALETERHLLSLRRFTWRAHSGEMFGIIPVRFHLEYGKVANFDQLLSFFPELDMRCRKHDELVGDLAKACKRLYYSLMNDPAFRNEVACAFESDLPEFPGTKEGFARMYNQGEAAELIAEGVVNGAGLLRNRWVEALWDPFQERFLAFRTRGPAGEAWKDVEHKAEELLASVELLIACLGETRNALSLRYDVPPNP